MKELRLRDLVNHFQNRTNKQDKFDVRKLELKKNNLTIKELLEMKIKKDYLKID